MLTKLVLMTFLYGVVSSSDLRFKNNCGYQIELVKTENERQPVKECDLPPGGTCSKSYSDRSMNFKVGWAGKSITLAEFSFNRPNAPHQDFYDLSVVDGFNVPMQIQPSNGPTVTCHADRCPDAYLYSTDDSKTHGIPTGGTFIVTMCP